jgi:hypothetical protein
MFYPLGLTAQKQIDYDWQQWEKNLSGLTERERIDLIRIGWGDSVKISGVWHHRFNVPKQKIWNAPDEDFVYLPNTSIKSEWWTTGGKDWFVIIEDTLIIDPDTLRYVQLTFSKKASITHKVIVKNGKKGKIKVKGIADSASAQKHVKIKDKKKK